MTTKVSIYSHHQFSLLFSSHLTLLCSLLNDQNHSLLSLQVILKIVQKNNSLQPRPYRPQFDWQPVDCNDYFLYSLNLEIKFYLDRFKLFFIEYLKLFQWVEVKFHINSLSVKKNKILLSQSKGIQQYLWIYYFLNALFHYFLFKLRKMVKKMVVHLCALWISKYQL